MGIRHKDPLRPAAKPVTVPKLATGRMASIVTTGCERSDGRNSFLKMLIPVEINPASLGLHVEDLDGEAVQITAVVTISSEEKRIYTFDVPNGSSATHGLSIPGGARIELCSSVPCLIWYTLYH